MGDYFVKKYMLKDLTKLDTKTRASISGIVTNIKNGPKYVKFTLDDNTGIITCILFKPDSVTLDFDLASMVTVIGEYEIDDYYAEKLKKLKVYRYQVHASVN